MRQFLSRLLLCLSVAGLVVAADPDPDWKGYLNPGWGLDLDLRSDSILGAGLIKVYGGEEEEKEEDPSRVCTSGEQSIKVSKATSCTAIPIPVVYPHGFADVSPSRWPAVKSKANSQTTAICSMTDWEDRPL